MPRAKAKTAAKKPVTKKKPVTRKKVSKKKTDIDTRTVTVTSSRARARRKKTPKPTTAQMLQSLTPPVLVNHDPAAYLTDPAHEIVKAIHAVAVQVKVLGEKLSKNPVAVPASVELTVEADERDEQLELAHDKIAELADTIARLEAKNEFLLSVVKRGKGE